MRLAVHSTASAALSVKDDGSHIVLTTCHLGTPRDQFYFLKPFLYHVPFTGVPSAEGDLSLRLIDIVIVVIGIPIAAVVSARLALRRVRISPLGVSRRATSASPRAYRLTPLLAGIALLAYFDAAGKPGSNSGQQLELLLGSGFLSSVWCWPGRGSQRRVLGSWLFARVAPPPSLPAGDSSTTPRQLSGSSVDW